MKKSILICLMIGVMQFGFSQAPQGIAYQAVARDAQGNPIANQSLTVQFSLHEASADGQIVLQESQTTTTNGQGLFSISVGEGVPSIGTFAGVNWGSGDKFLQVQADFGNGFVDLGTQQLMSVPYSLFSMNTKVNVSAIGDTLTVGNQKVIIPGLSSANPNYQPTFYTSGNGVTDIDGNFYPSIIINGQEWMQKNLAVSKFRNGVAIPTNLSNSAWSSAASAFTLYGNNSANKEIYGALYNYYAVIDSRGICPTGWHVPSDNEWTTLISTIDPNLITNAVNSEQSFTAGGNLKDITIWTAPNTGANNLSGFKALPGGNRSWNGNFDFSPNNGYWWSSTQAAINLAWAREIYYNSSVIQRTSPIKEFGFSVRCVKD